MSGNGGNPHSLRDLLGTYEKSGLAPPPKSPILPPDADLAGLSAASRRKTWISSSNCG